MNRAEEESFTEFVEGSGDRLLAFARLLIFDRGEAEDALQVALMRLARQWHRNLDAPDAYMRRALVNIARDRARRRHLVPALLRSARTPEGSYEDDPVPSATREALEELLGGLPPQQRFTVVLRVVEGHSEAETAALLKCAKGTVKSNLARGLDRLRANLTDSADTTNGPALAVPPLNETNFISTKDNH